MAAIEQELLGIRHLLWGVDIKRDIFKRWSQGFYFSVSEPTALEQSEGGPCAVIAPVQAFILKNLVLKYKDLSFRDREMTADIQNQLLIIAVGEILEQCQATRYNVVSLHSDHIAESSTSSPGNEEESCSQNNGVVMAAEPATPLLDPASFHDNLKIRTFLSLDDVKKYYCDHVTQLKAPFGVLLFLYSVIATRTLEKVKNDSCNDVSEPLIDDTYGYGSQSLINLMITGKASTYVWDHEQDVGGLKLKGLERQSRIGFITIMEHLRYCTVGSFYKNPTDPVWVLGSDTHLTVVFSTERRLVSPETKTEKARRVFRHYDPDGNNFINSNVLGELMQSLDLVSEEAYLDIMRKKLDPENLGIILLNAFMEEFFPREDHATPDLFPLVHYNGLAQSNVNGQIRYRIGECVLLETDLRAVSESNGMLTVLQTKWPNIEIKWDELGSTPSLN